MKMSSFLPQDQVFWYINRRDIFPLKKNITTDVLVIGGGMAGLSAAQSFLNKGLQVVLIEKNFCGAGASGKSSGFITPDSELSLHHFIKKYGPAEAKRIWDFVLDGVEFIRANVKKFNLACDYQEQDTLVVANTNYAFTYDIEKEHQARQQLQYVSTLYKTDQLPHILGSDQYKGGVVYGNTFGIHGYAYCQGMRQVLQSLGAHVYEETPALDIKDHTVTTPYATIQAEHIIVCVDRFLPDLGIFSDSVYHAQTFLMLSAPLSEHHIKKMFPERPFMMWDSDLMYQYFRLTGDNRLMLGGASVWHTYENQEKHNNRYMIQKLIRYAKTKFPQTSLQFDYIWPGLVGVSKDIFPIAGFVPHLPSVYCISAAAGLPWAATLGAYSAERIIHNDTSLDTYLDPSRTYKIGSLAQTLLGKKLAFAVSNYLSVG